MEFHYDRTSSQANRKITIMYLDNDPISRKVLSMGLPKKVDINLISESESISVLKFLKEHPNEVDLLIQDHIRPDINGIEFLSIIRSDESMRRLPVIFLTDGFPHEEDYKRVDELDAQVVEKPMTDAQELIDAISLAVKENPKKLIYTGKGS